jgi:fucose 4-O-acetylase-like acetyltransferase
VVGAAGVGIFFLSSWFDRLPMHWYAVYDYWHTSPNFFLARVGVLMTITWFVYAWCRWGLGERGFSPFVQLGQASLLVYWVHIEFVYGRFSILHKRSQTIPTATLGLIVIFAAMVLLAVARRRSKGRGPEILARIGAYREQRRAAKVSAAGQRIARHVLRRLRAEEMS